jgi:hypothetical protein
MTADDKGGLAASKSNAHMGGVISGQARRTAKDVERIKAEKGDGPWTEKGMDYIVDTLREGFDADIIRIPNEAAEIMIQLRAKVAALEAKDIEGDHKLAARVRNAIKCISSEGQNDRIHEGDLKVLRRAADELDRLPVKVAKDIELEGLRKAVRKACIQIIGKGSFREVELVDGGTWKEREKAIGEWKDWNIGWTVIPIEILEKLIAAATATSKEWHRTWTLS